MINRMAGSTVVQLVVLVTLFMTVSEGRPSDLVEKPDKTYTLWYGDFCKESNNGNFFFVRDIGYVECNDDSCGLDFPNINNKYKVDYCFICCFAKITS